MAIATIANTASLSGAVDFGNLRASAVEPAATLAATSARLIFWGSLDGTSFKIIEDEDSTRFVVVVATTENTVRTLPPSVFYPYRWLKVQTTTTDGSTAVAQDAEKTFLFGVEKYTG